MDKKSHLPRMVGATGLFKSKIAPLQWCYFGSRVPSVKSEGLVRP